MKQVMTLSTINNLSLSLSLASNQAIYRGHAFGGFGQINVLIFAWLSPSKRGLLYHNKWAMRIFPFFEPLLNEEIIASATIIMSEFTSTQGDLQGAKLQPIHRNCLPLYLEERFHTIFQGFDAIEKAYNASEVHNNNNKTDEHIER